MDAAFLPIGVDAVEKGIDIGELVESAQNVEPAEGEEASVCLFIGLVEVGDAQSESNQVIVLIYHKIGKFQVDKREILIDIDIDFLVGEGDEVVEVLESGIDGQEELFGIGVNLFA